MIIVSEEKQDSIEVLCDEFEQELDTIAQWWMDQAFDTESQCFMGEMSHDGIPMPKKTRGIILYTRILWFFSEYAFYQKEKGIDNTRSHQMADSVYSFLMDAFFDREHGGVFWEVSYQGECLKTRKQVYAQAFAIYALTAYYKLTKNKDALAEAYSIFDLIEKFGRDKEKGGYYEAFSQQWSLLDDMRLSSKDLNSPKTMNTHLHVLEAYTSLYAVEKHPDVESALKYLLDCYQDYFIHPANSHVKMFLDNNWQDQSQAYSYGHDIESSWLIWEAVELLNDKEITEQFKETVVDMVDICLVEGLADDGSVLDLYDFATQKRVEERVWWVQVEALVGLVNAYQITRENTYLEAIVPIWTFIKNELKDPIHGEWHWLAKCDQKHDYSIYKIGFWKGPYHNGRAMLELSKRLLKIKK